MTTAATSNLLLSASLNIIKKDAIYFLELLCHNIWGRCLSGTCHCCPLAQIISLHKLVLLHEEVIIICSVCSTSHGVAQLCITALVTCFRLYLHLLLLMVVLFDSSATSCLATNRLDDHYVVATTATYALFVRLKIDLMAGCWRLRTLTRRRFIDSSGVLSSPVRHHHLIWRNRVCSSYHIALLLAARGWPLQRRPSHVLFRQNFIYSLLLLVARGRQIRSRTPTILGGCIVQHAVHDDMVDPLHAQIVRIRCRRRWLLAVMACQLVRRSSHKSFWDIFRLVGMSRWIVSILCCGGILCCCASFSLIHLLFAGSGWKVHLRRQQGLLLALLWVVGHVSALYLMLMVSESTSAVWLLGTLRQILRAWLAFLWASTCIGIIHTWLFSNKIMLGRLSGRVVLFIGTRHMDTTACIWIHCSCGVLPILWLSCCCRRLIIVHCPHLFIFDKNFIQARDFINYSS